MQTRDMIEEMAAADLQQKGWHSTRSAMARRRFLQVILPYRMDTTLYSCNGLDHRHAW